MPMRTLTRTGLWLLAAALLAAGCEKVEWKWPFQKPEPKPPVEAAATQPAEPGEAVAASQPAEPAPPPKSAEELRQEVATLEAEKKVLEARVQELSLREKALSEKVNELDFITKQQVRQIDALRDAARERDEYRTKADELALKVARLEGMVEALGGRKPAPATRPATPPAVVPDDAPPPPATRPAEKASPSDIPEIKP